MSLSVERIKELEKALHKDRSETINFCATHNRLFLYGAGRTAVLLIGYMKAEDISIAGIIVSDGEKKSDSLDGIPVTELHDYYYKEGDGIIIAVAELRQKMIMDNLLKHVGGDIQNHVYNQKIFSAGVITSEEDWYAGTKKEGAYFQKYELLDRIGQETGTDKSELCHNYLRKYEFFLRDWKDDAITIMELGVFKGQSLKMWKQYFPKAKVVGVDIDETCKEFQEENVEIVISDLTELSNLMELQKYEPTVLIDDASHEWKDQILSLVTLFPSVKRGGVFIMEDVGTSFSKHLNSSENNASLRGYDFLSLVCEATTGNIDHLAGIDDAIKEAVNDIAKDVDMISFVYGSCIIVKR